MYTFENILIAKEDLVIRIIKQEFATVTTKDKTALIYSTENTFFAFLMKLRALMNVWRDINTRLRMKSISDILMLVINFLDDMYTNDSDN